MEPDVILVDLLDRPLGTMPKMQAHSTPQLHRAFSVFLYQEDRLLVQRRAAHKYHCGGLWANACCSHPRPGEKLEECAARRLREETGATPVTLTHHHTFTYFARLDHGLYEYEYDHVFLGEYHGDVKANPEEVDVLQWVSIPILLDDMRTEPEQYAPWFLICAPRVIETITKINECII
ncbi:MAG: isopentenyl-diphosphate Delta-isomerase [Oscillospiraceae bacterium]|nr:isopentenyl-diphosphate Delta-isomerase [Oscillospiraceae bacterium]